MNNVYFEIEWYKLLESFNPELKKYDIQLTSAKLEFPKKSAILSFYSDQIKELNKIIDSEGYPMSTNLASLRMKFLQEYSKTNSDVNNTDRTNDLESQLFFNKLINICEALTDELNELEYKIEEIGYNQSEIENVLLGFESDFDRIQESINKIFMGVSFENFILEARKDSWFDNIMSIRYKVIREIKKQNFNRNLVEITSMFVNEDLSFEYNTTTKNYDLIPFKNLIGEIISDLKREMNEVKVDEKMEQIFHARMFIEDCNVANVLLTLLKRDRLIESHSDKFTILNKTLNFLNYVKDQRRLDLVILQLLESGILSKDDTQYRWNGIGKNKVESLMDFSRVLEEENIAKHIGGYKEIFLTYNSYFNTKLKDGVRQAQEVYDYQNEIRFRNHFTFIKTIK